MGLGLREMLILIIGFVIIALAIIFIIMGIMKKANAPKKYDHSEKWNDAGKG